MRILGYTQRWPKLKKKVHTTFRFTRRDRDWQVGEVVHEVLHPRSKGREVLQVALIISKEQRWVFTGKKPRGAKAIIAAEAHEDGFNTHVEMLMWLSKAHGHEKCVNEPINKLTLKVQNSAGVVSV